MPYQKYNLATLDGGMVTDLSYNLLELGRGYSSYLYNIDLSRYGFPQKRPDPSDVLGPLAGEVTGVYEFRKLSDNSVYYVATHGTVAQVWNSVAMQWEDIRINLADGARFDFLTFANQLVMVNGIDDSALWDGAVVTTPGAFPKVKYLTDYRLRIVAAGDPNNPSLLYISHTGDATIWDPEAAGSNAVRAYVSPDDGEPITGVLNVGDGGVLIGKTSAIYGLFGYKRENFIVELLDPSVGVSSHKTMVYARPYAYFVHDTGVYRMESGAPPQRISLEIQDLFNDNLYRDNLHLARGTLLGRLYVVSIPKTDGWLTLVYNIDRERWSVWDAPVLGEFVQAKQSYRRLLYAEPGGMQLKEIRLGTPGVPEAYLETLELDLGVLEADKDIKDLYLVFVAGEEDYKVNVYIQPDQCNEWLPLAEGEVISGRKGTRRVLRVPVGQTVRYHKLRVEGPAGGEFFPVSAQWWFEPKEVL